MKVKILLSIVFGVGIVQTIEGALIETHSLGLLFSNYTHAGVRSWGMGGVTVADTSPTALINNPGALVFLNGPQIEVEGGYVFKSKWIAEMDNLSHFLKPQFVGAILPFEKFHFGVGYYLAYQSDLYGESEVISEHGYPTGSYFAYQQSTKLEDLVLSTAYHLKDRIGIGISVMYLRGTREERGFISSTGWANGIAGIVGLNLRPKDNLSVGFHLQTRSILKGKLITPYWSPYFSFNNFYKVKDHTPLTASIGFGWKPKPKVNLVGQITFINHSWGANNIKDTYQLHLGSEYCLSKRAIFRGGFFTLFAPFKKSFLENLNMNHQYFLTLGSTLISSPLSLEISLLDSHLLTKGKLKQTKILLGSRFNY